MAQQVYHSSVHRFALFTVIFTWLLICLGGHVTSTESGLAVPDWPTSYGFNMFLFPWTRMVGGIFWEHSHRLMASLVGVLTFILACLIWQKETRRWIKILALVAVFGVIFQGVLGGLRVVLIKQQIGIFHAAIAQLFLSVLCILATATSRSWIFFSVSKETNPTRWLTLKRFAIGLTFLVFIQLMLGATMRHEHAGLAVPDFPKAYGNWFPPLNKEALAQINATRAEQSLPPTSVGQIVLHMHHRALAVILVCLFGALFVYIKRTFKDITWLRKWIMTWKILIFIQFFLGIATVLTQKAAEVATAHVGVGASILAIGVMLTAKIWQHQASVKVS